MSPDARRWATLPMLVFLLASALTAVGALIIATRRAAAHRNATETPAAAPWVAADRPIAPEAQVFRTRASVLAISPTPGPRRAAHPRTLASFRALRAYPGAPPRIPHGLTPNEFRTDGCNTCHERGGFSQRFGAYVPLTPHPEMGACLQCHVGNAQLMAIPLPSTDASDRCRQCHAPGAGRWTDSTLSWVTTTWPQPSRPAIGDAPPSIPHDLQMRGNCLSCHAAPFAIEEIRTSHPERADCRGCHVATDTRTGEFVRPTAGAPDGRGGTL